MDEQTRMMPLPSGYVSQQTASYNVCRELYSFVYSSYYVASKKHTALKFHYVTSNMSTIFVTSSRNKGSITSRFY
jgi:hypothetical protein